MGIEVDELLIFKNRKLGEAKKPEPKKEKQQPKMQKPEPSPPPEPEPEPEEPEEPEPTPPIREKAVRPAPVQVQKQAPVKIERQRVEKPQVIIQTSEPSPELEQYPAPANMADVEPNREDVAKSIKQQESGRGKMKYGDLKGVGCTNHPWRQAYGICAYCERPFCYPDTIPYGGKLYCLEDIDQISRMPPKTSEKPHAWTYLSSVLFIISAIALAYSIYPSTFFIVQYIQSSGINGLWNYVLVNYTFSLIDLVASILCLASGFIILKNSASAFAFASAVLSATIILVSYEYLSSNASYLFFVVVAMLINLAIIAGGRMSLIGTQKVQSFYGQIDWPKPEVF